MISWFIAAWMLGSSISFAQENSLDEAQQHLQEGRYAKGYRVLNDYIRAQSQDVDGCARAYDILARFQEQLIGSPKMALETRRRMLEIGLPPGDPRLHGVESEIHRLEDLLATWQSVNDEIEQLGAETQDPVELKERAARLESLLQVHPDYPFKNSLLFYLGNHLLRAGHEREAYQTLVQATELRPAIAFLHPIILPLEQAYSGWMRRFASTLAWGYIGLFILVTATLLVIARPWQWLTGRHLSRLVATLVLWSLAYWTMIVLLQDSYAAPAPPLFHRRIWNPGHPGNPWWDLLWTLFEVSLLGILGVVALGMAASRTRLRWTAAVGSGLAGCLLFLSLTVAFYLRCLDSEPEFSRELTIQSLESGSLNASLAFKTEDIVPFVLLDPLKHADIPLNSVEDEVMRRWLQRFREDPPEGIAAPQNPSEVVVK